MDLPTALLRRGEVSRDHHKAPEDERDGSDLKRVPRYSDGAARAWPLVIYDERHRHP